MSAASCSASVTSASAAASAGAACSHCVICCPARSSRARASASFSRVASARSAVNVSRSAGSPVIDACGFQRREPAVEPLLELRVRALLLEIPVEALLHPPADLVPARAPFGVVAQRQRIPPAVEFDGRHHDGTGPRHQGLGLREKRIGRAGVLDAPVDGVEPLARQPGDAAVLVDRALQQPAQRLGGMDPLGRGDPHRRVLGVERDPHQLVLVADSIDRRAAAIVVLRAQDEFSAHLVRAFGGIEDGPYRGRIGQRSQQVRQRRGDGRTGLRFALGPHGREQDRRVAAAPGRRGADVRRRVGGEHLHQHRRIRRQRADAEHPLRRIGVLVKAATEEQFV